jgi:hypothetical protein
MLAPWQSTLVLVDVTRHSGIDLHRMQRIVIVQFSLKFMLVQVFAAIGCKNLYQHKKEISYGNSIWTE